MTGPLTLWTIQRRADWERAMAEGVLRVDPNCREEYFGAAYEWMHRQAVRRLKGYSGRPLLWAWYRPKPNVHRSVHFPSGEDAVRIEFSVPRDQLLLSHFAAWHVVLNDGYLSLSEQEYEAFEARHEACCSIRERPAVCQAEVEGSWERVFNLDVLTPSCDWGRSPIQAVLEAVPATCVRAVTHVPAR